MGSENSPSIVPARSRGTSESLKLAYIVIPMSGTIMAMWVMLKYDISEQKAHEIRLQLDEQRAV
jgi:Na+/melibiose symporter-like transporter